METENWNIPVTSGAGITVHYFETLQSTNLKAVEIARANGAAWTVIAAREQTAGKGRYERKWESPRGGGLWFSVILRPDIAHGSVNLLNLGTAVIVRDFIADILTGHTSAGHTSVQLKWPNDILVNGKKICGILMESEIHRNKINYLVVGVGLNVNQTESDFSEELRSTAVSLRMVSGKKWNLKALLNRLLRTYQVQQTRNLRRNFAGVVSVYQRHLAFRNDHVRLNLRDRHVDGILKGIDELGYLILTIKGEDQRITSGDLWTITEKETI